MPNRISIPPVFYRRPIQAHHSSPRFSGIRATRLAQEQLLSDVFEYETLKNVLTNDDTPYLGTLPPQFMLNGLLTEQQALKAFDTITSRLWSTLDSSSSKSSKPPGLLDRMLLGLNLTHPTQLLWQAIKIKPISDGGTGNTYKITVNGQPYLLKAIARGWLREPNDFIPFNEAANGLFFTARNVRNMSRFYAGNPFAGWMITEFIDKSIDMNNRTGPTMQELGYEMLDDKPDNYIGDIRVDHGGIVRRITPDVR